MRDPSHDELYTMMHTLDQRVTSHLSHDEQWHKDVDKRLADNTEITTQVRDILASFKTIASIAKWVTVIGVAIAAVVNAVHSFFK